jgi:hypothetical protein
MRAKIRFPALYETQISEKSYQYPKERSGEAFHKGRI